MGERKPSFIQSLVGLLFTKLAFGFFVSMIVHSNAKCSWQKLRINPDEKVTVFTYFFGTFFSVHTFGWFGVFSFLYKSVVSIALDFIYGLFKFGTRYKLILMIISEILFGYWAAGEILGGWCDLERIGDCIQDEKVELDYQCESFLINGFTRMTQSICERLSASYDEEEDAYVRKPTSACIFVFRYLGHFIMTTLSFIFTFYVML